MTARISTTGIRAVLLDIEGTTTPIAFVHEILFSYARANVKDYLQQKWDSPDVVEDLEKLCEENAVDQQQGFQPPVIDSATRDAHLDSLIAYINWLIDRDRKSTGLKSLQGKIWKQGYIDGTLKSQVFPDVPPAMELWHRAGLAISIFSSGSVLAQKLLFQHTNTGDLTPLISNYFDTSSGPKTDAQSYQRIASELEYAPKEILFVSDVMRELDAAREAGMEAVLCVRPGNQPQNCTESYPVIHSFEEIGSDLV